MASKMKLDASTFEGRNINLKRFAYDVFKHSALKFGAHEVCMGSWEGVENKYSRPDFIKVLLRIMFKYQVTQRMTWCCLFYVRYFITKFNSFEDIRDAVQMVLPLSRVDADGCVFLEVLISLAIICELVRYLYHLSSKMYMSDLASDWTKHFCGIRERFEEAGGFTEMYNRFNRPKYESLDLFYNEFIPKFCSPYDNLDIYPRLYDIFYEESNKYYERIAKNLSLEEQREYNVVYSATIFRFSRPVMQAKEILRIAIPINFKDFATEIPKWITSIRSPRYVEIGDGVTAPQNLPTTSRAPQNLPTTSRAPQNLPTTSRAPQNLPTTSRAPQNLPTTSRKEARKFMGSPTQVEGLKLKSILGSIEEDFGKLYLGFAKTKRSNKSENRILGIQLTKELLRYTGVSLADAATSSHNPPGASGQEMVRGTRELPTQEEGRKTKSSSPSSEEDSGPSNLVCSGTGPGNLRPHGSGVSMEEFEKWRFQTFCTPRTERVETVHTNVSYRNHLLNSWYGADVVTAYRNHQATSSLREKRQRRGSSSQMEGRKRKSSSISSEEDIKQLNLGPSESDQPSEPGNTEFEIGTFSLAEMHKLKEEAILWKSKYFMDYLLRFDLHNGARDPNECAEFDELLRKNTPLYWCPPDTSSLEETRDIKESSTQEEGHKKKSRLLSEEDF